MEAASKSQQLAELSQKEARCESILEGVRARLQRIASMTGLNLVFAPEYSDRGSIEELDLDSFVGLSLSFGFSSNPKNKFSDDFRRSPLYTAACSDAKNKVLRVYCTKVVDVRVSLTMTFALARVVEDAIRKAAPDQLAPHLNTPEAFLRHVLPPGASTFDVSFNKDPFLKKRYSELAEFVQELVVGRFVSPEAAAAKASPPAAAKAGAPAAAAAAAASAAKPAGSSKRRRQEACPSMDLAVQKLSMFREKPAEKMDRDDAWNETLFLLVDPSSRKLMGLLPIDPRTFEGILHSVLEATRSDRSQGAFIARELARTRLAQESPFSGNLSEDYEELCKRLAVFGIVRCCAQEAAKSKYSWFIAYFYWMKRSIRLLEFAPEVEKLLERFGQHARGLVLRSPKDGSSTTRKDLRERMRSLMHPEFSFEADAADEDGGNAASDASALRLVKLYRHVAYCTRRGSEAFLEDAALLLKLCSDPTIASFALAPDVLRVLNDDSNETDQVECVAFQKELLTAFLDPGRVVWSNGKWLPDPELMGRLLHFK